MKTFGSNSLSALLYYLTRIGFIVAAGFLLFVVLSLSLGLISYWLEWDNSLVSLNMDENFDLMVKPMNLHLKGEMGVPKIIPILVFMTAAFYVMALWFLVKMFKIFRSDSIFRKEVVSSLNGLAFSFFVAALLSFFMMYFSPHSDSDFLAGVLLLFFSLILFFIKEVFRQGVDVQEEHNLTI